MSKAKKSVSIILSLLMIIGLFLITPLTVGAETFTSGDWEYILMDSDEARIIHYNGSETELTVPDKIDGYTVSIIGGGSYEFVFENKDVLTKVNIPNSIESLDYYAFADCVSLKSINIPYGVTEIGYAVFSGCTNLSEVTISNSVGGIHEHAFENCLALKKITIPNSVFGIADEAFKNCTSLSDVSFDNGIEGIGQYAFYGCDKLKNIEIPKSVSRIGVCAFGYYCSDESQFERIENFLISGFTGSEAQHYSKNNNFDFISLGKTEMTMQPDYEYHVLDDGTVEIYDYNGPFVSEIDIPSKIDGYIVSTISGQLFLEYPIVEKINIPDCLTKIDIAFADCKSIKEINVSPNNGDFTSLDGNLYSKDLSKLVQYALGKEESEFVLPSSVICIGYCSLSSSKLKTIKMSSNVKFIEAYAFSHSKELESINLSEKLESISYHAFSGCTNLKELIIPKSVTEFGYHACGFIEVITDNKTKDFSIYGYNGTAAETYAKDNGFEFISLDETPNEIIQPTTTEGSQPITTEPVTTEPSTSINTEPAEGLDEYGYYINDYYLAGKIKGEDKGLPNVDKSLRFTKNLEISDSELFLDSVELEAGDSVSIVRYKGNNTFDTYKEGIPVRESGKYQFNLNPVNSSFVYGLKASSGTGASGHGYSNDKKANPAKISVKAKTVKIKKLKKKAQKVKAITVKKAKGKVTYKLVKKGSTAKIFKLAKINSKGVITLNKWKKAKKGTYKIKVTITAAGNANYKSKTVSKAVKIKVK
ncbi:MAG: leucine-rich repeat protein [Ruminococcus sp.]|nr:leucine-rich repeat protein [Ruminococcus sp.]